MTKLKIEPLTVVVVMVVILLFTSGCGFISLKAPTTQDMIQDGAETIAYFIAKKNPETAKGILDEYVQPDGTDTLAYWTDWKALVVSKVKDDFLKMKVERWLRSVDIELQMKVPSERIEIVKGVLEGFISGLQAGIDANLSK